MAARARRSHSDWLSAADMREYKQNKHSINQPRDVAKATFGVHADLWSEAHFSVRAQENLFHLHRRRTRSAMAEFVHEKSALQT